MTLVLIDEAASARLVARVPQGEARLEKTLRDLIHDHPDVLPVREFDPGFGRLVTVARELNIPGCCQSNANSSLDAVPRALCAAA